MPWYSLVILASKSKLSFFLKIKNCRKKVGPFPGILLLASCLSRWTTSSRLSPWTLSSPLPLPLGTTSNLLTCTNPDVHLPSHSFYLRTFFNRFLFWCDSAGNKIFLAFSFYVCKGLYLLSFLTEVFFFSPNHKILGGV